MVFMEGKQQMIDLIGALQVKRQREQTEEDSKRKELENEMLRQQMEQSKKEADLKMSLLTGQVYRPGTPMDSPNTPGFGNYWNRQRDLEDLAILTGNRIPRGIGGGGRGGGGGGGGQPSDDENRIASAQADLAEEQARIAQYQRQGRGGGGGGQPQQAPKGGGNPSQMLGLGGPNIDDGARRQSVMSGQEIQSPEEYSAGWDRDRNIAEATRAAELEREKFLLGGGAMSDKIVPPDMQVGALAGKRAGDAASKEQSARAAELRRIALYKIREDVDLSTAPPEVQQAAADFTDKQRSILKDIISNGKGKNIQWGAILRDIADGTLE